MLYEFKIILKLQEVHPSTMFLHLQFHSIHTAFFYLYFNNTLVEWWFQSTKLSNKTWCLHGPWAPSSGTEACCSKYHFSIIDCCTTL